MARTDSSPSAAASAVAPAGGTAQQAFTNIHDDLVTLREHSGTTITYSTRYEAFGTQRDTTGVPTAIGYQGSLTDPLTDLVDMGFRQYDTATGAFTRADTVIGDLNAPGTLSRYSHGFGDPINTVDPSGHWPDWLDEKVNEARERFSTAGATVSAAWSTTSSAVSGVVTASAGVVAAGQDARRGAGLVHDDRAERAQAGKERQYDPSPVSYTHLRAHETVLDLVCRLLLEKKTQKEPHNRLRKTKTECIILL